MNFIGILIIAVKATDRSIKTAFNLCEKCFKTSKGYYIQQGDELVYQNYGVRIKINNFGNEKIKYNALMISKKIVLRIQTISLFLNITWRYSDLCFSAGKADKDHSFLRLNY
jgi:hypothetical protein